jgi:hypothetical protein
MPGAQKERAALASRPTTVNIPLTDPYYSALKRLRNPT